MNNNVEIKIGQRLKEVRQKLKLSRESFSKQLGIPARSLANYESGAEPKGIFLQRIKEAIAWAEAELAAQEKAKNGRPGVAAPPPEIPPKGPDHGPTANGMRIMALTPGGGATDMKVPEELSRTELLLLEFGAWARRMTLADKDLQPRIEAEVRGLINKIEDDWRKHQEKEHPPGRPIGAEKNSGGRER